jgi:hypothetical protein
MNPFENSRYVSLEQGPEEHGTEEHGANTTVNSGHKRSECRVIMIGLGCFVSLILIFSLGLLIYEETVNRNHLENFPDSNLKISVINWNLHDFGIKKLNNPIQMEGIKNIISSYDVIMLSELEQSECDKDDQCPMKTYFKQNFPNHDFYMSPSLGFNKLNNQGKEQYGFLVSRKLNYREGFYGDPEGIFARPPHYVQIVDYNIYLAIVHTTPWNSKDWPNGSKTKQEVVELSHFFETISGDIILMGDLNLCSPNILDNEDIRKNYQWILNDSQMTNIGKQQCAYDRIISRKNFSRYIEPKVVRDSRIIDLDLSDHYPIQINVT